MQQIAAEKKKQNIAEYLLFMWQMEDLVRGLDFDLKRLLDEILVSVEDDGERHQNIIWFQKLVKEMKDAGLEVSGHHSETYEILNELQMLQHTMMTVINDPDFQKKYAEAQPLIEEFRQKTEKIPRSDAETALTAIYGVLTLRLAGKEISPETRAAVDIFSKYMAALASAYRAMKTGHLPLNN